MWANSTNPCVGSRYSSLLAGASRCSAANHSSVDGALSEFLQMLATTCDHFGAKRSPNLPNPLNQLFQRIVSHVFPFSSAWMDPVQSIVEV